MPKPSKPSTQARRNGRNGTSKAPSTLRFIEALEEEEQSTTTLIRVTNPRKAALLLDIARMLSPYSEDQLAQLLLTFSEELPWVEDFPPEIPGVDAILASKRKRESREE